MTQDIKKEEDIKGAVAEFKITPYSEVKNNLDIISCKTRKALGIKLRQAKPFKIKNEQKI
jgi:hypothetical protein